MRYDEACAFLDTVNQWEKKYTLEKMKVLVELLGNPQNDYRVIHVTGTNGKGSVCAMISNILKYAGYRAGMNSSPHLVTIRERFRINNEIISKQDFADTIEVMLPAIKKMETMECGTPSYFEILTAASLLYFSSQKVDFAVMEVGLGGRLDATNIVNPCCSVITNVKLDHSKTLGNTTEKIAFEKAGIIKNGVPVVCGETVLKPLSVIQKQAKLMGAPVLLRNRDFSATAICSKKRENRFYYVSKNGKKSYIMEKMLGPHQTQNAACALAITDALKMQGISVPENAVMEGLKTASWAGRFEILSDNPLVLIDGAHNLAGSRSFLDTYSRNIPGKCTMICGMLRDKNIDRMMKNFCRISQNIVLSRPGSDRAAEMDTLKDKALKYGAAAVIIEDVCAAVDHVWPSLNSENGLIVVGSLYLIGAARNSILKNLNKPNDLED